MTVLRRPTNAAAAGDPIPFFKDGETHLFYLSSPPGTLDYPKRVRTTWQHAQTTDFRDWKNVSQVLEPGGANAYDGGGIWTGSVVESHGIYYLFYTGHHVGAANPQTICVATSADLVRFERHARNPVITPIAGYEAIDWRDPYVFYNEAEQRWWMLIAARLDRGPQWRRGCLPSPRRGTCSTGRSSPIRSTSRGQLFAPNVQRCGRPAVVGISSSLGFPRTSGTIYRVADLPRGPFRVPVDDALGGRRWYAAKSAPQADGSRVFFGWVHDFVVEGRPRWLWGGDFAAPRLVTPDANGELSVRLHPAVEAMFGEGSATATKLEAIGGEAHAMLSDVLPKTSLIRAEFTVTENPAAFGLALAENEDLEGWFVTFDRKRRLCNAQHVNPGRSTTSGPTSQGVPAGYRNVDGPIVAETLYATESGGQRPDSLIG